MKWLWIGIFITLLIWSGVHPKDQVTWYLEVAPALIGAAVLFWTRRSFPLTPFVYGLILLHCAILMVGGHYTYAEVPFFDLIRDLTGGQRNNFDKLGHFAQGFVPAMIAREIVIRRHIINGSSWRAFFIICFCLAFSALYELIEWWTALVLKTGADDFLGTQGYVWDTQSDMFMALVGAIISLLLLSRFHDRQLSALPAVVD